MSVNGKHTPPAVSLLGVRTEVDREVAVLTRGMNLLDLAETRKQHVSLLHGWTQENIPFRKPQTPTVWPSSGRTDTDIIESLTATEQLPAIF